MKRAYLLFCPGTVVKALAFVLVLCGTRVAFAGEFLLFPSLTGVARSSEDIDHRKRELEPAIDFFYSRDQGSMRVLAEFLLSRDENELERFQLGWSAGSGATLWLGRFHAPTSYWNTAYHHGAYLQPSISRPGIADYEDQDGVMPMHITGALLAGSTPLQNRRLSYEFALGAGPVFKDKLEPLNLFSPRDEGKISVSSKLSLQSEDNAANEQGVFFGYTEIPLLQAPTDRIRQRVVGAFFNRDLAQWRVLSELTVIQARFETAARSDQTFANAYLHVEYQLDGQWTAYGRGEASRHSDNNAYLSLFPDFIKSRALVGARWTPAARHAFKFELSSNHRQDGHRYQELGMQWSMVFP